MQATPDLFSEHDISRLLDLILQHCRDLAVADAGSVYLVDYGPDGQKVLRFEAHQSDSLQLNFQTFVMPLTDQSIAGFAALTGRTLNIDDVYALPLGVPYVFNKAFDEQVKYRTKSMLTVPMRDHHGEVIGVIQLINHKGSPDTELGSPEIAAREVTAFPAEAREAVESFSSQAAAILGLHLADAATERMCDGLVHFALSAVERFDQPMAGHSERIAELAVNLAAAVNDVDRGPLRGMHFTDEQIREIRYAGLLQRVGVLNVQPAVLRKARKLYDEQLEVIKLRFRLARTALEAEHNRRQFESVMKGDRAAFLASLGQLDAELAEKLRRLDEDLQAVIAANEPTPLAPEIRERLLQIPNRGYTGTQAEVLPLLDEAELRALTVPRGSLTEEERREIESAASHTHRLLSLIPWPPQLSQIPLIAGAAYERLDGTGYPWGLRGDQIPLQSRMMAIASIYDALTASDRPSKKAVPVDKAIDILRQEAELGHIDRELLDIFIQRRVFDIAVAGTMRQMQRRGIQ